MCESVRCGTQCGGARYFRSSNTNSAFKDLEDVLEQFKMNLSMDDKILFSYPIENELINFSITLKLTDLQPLKR